MKPYITTVAILCGLSLNFTSRAGEGSLDTAASLWNAGQPDSHAPIGVMGDHTHGAGEYMLSYRFMTMEMEGHRRGTHSLSAEDVFGLGYDVAAKDMTMDMHMIGMMHAPTDKLTLLAMVNFVEKEMNLTRKPVHAMGHMGGHGGMMMGGMAGGHGGHGGHGGDSFSHASSGLGDITFGGMYKIHDANRQRIHLNLAIGLPTAGVQEKEHGMLLPYGMQLGSGTWDLKPGITWLGQRDNCSFGAQAMGTIRLEDQNEAGYALGDQLNLTAWLARTLNESLSASLRLSYTNADAIDGHFSSHHSHAAPPFIQGNYGGEFLEGGIGLNCQIRKGALKGHRLAIEGIFPLCQDLNGVGMKREYSVVAGWQFAF
ncbi:MAG: transporter [Verrucomicrobiaceae bacterium]|nr:transporter [Verrucomicrobiaceae bacterium]